MSYKKKSRLSGKMLSRLARKNVKKSAEDYLIYFFTLTFAVSLFYTFNSIEEQFNALGLTDLYSFLSAAKSVMAACSVFVCIVMGFLVVYANDFMMKRRKREFGIYGVLGMGKNDISRMMTKETILIGSASLLCGLPLGVALSQLLNMITVHMAKGNVDEYTFIFSPGAVAVTIIFFSLMFFIVHVLRIWEMRKMKLIDLLYADRKNEELPQMRKGGIFLCAASFILMAAGYVVFHQEQEMDFFQAIASGSGFIALGTVLFFLSSSVLVLGILKGRKGFYYHRLNLFVVNQLGSHMRREGLSMAVVCILLYLSITMMGTGTGMGQSFIAKKEMMVPYDLSVIYYFDGGKADGMLHQSIRDVLMEKKTDVAEYLGNTEEFTIYKNDSMTASELFGTYARSSKDKKVLFSNESVDVVGVDDYNKIRSLSGQKPIVLGENEYAINYNEPDARVLLERYAEENQPIELSGTSLQLKNGGIYEMTLYNRNVLLDTGTLIVPQNLTAKISPFMKVMDGIFTTYGTNTYEAAQTSLLEMESLDLLFQNKTDIFVEFLSSQVMMTYLGMYLGITFLITAGAVLALQQLTQATENEKRYALLGRLGAGNRAMKQALMTQLGICFGLPLAVAAIHSAVMICEIYGGIQYLTAADMAQNILSAAGLAAAIYGIYFITTYTACRRILKI